MGEVDLDVREGVAGIGRPAEPVRAVDADDVRGHARAQQRRRARQHVLARRRRRADERRSRRRVLPPRRRAARTSRPAGPPGGRRRTRSRGRRTGPRRRPRRRDAVADDDGDDRTAVRGGERARRGQRVQRRRADGAIPETSQKVTTRRPSDHLRLVVELGHQLLDAGDLMPALRAGGASIVITLIAAPPSTPSSASVTSLISFFLAAMMPLSDAYRCVSSHSASGPARAPRCARPSWR